MRSSLAFLSALVAAAAAQSYNDKFSGLYFIQDTGAPLVIDRVDPILLPGQIPGNHVHSIVGSNAFRANVTYDDLQSETTCSTVFVKQDKSIYWLPSLYFQSPQNGSFTRIKERPEHKIYYMNRSGKNETINEFPKGFRMIAGDATLRAPAATKQLQQVTQWYCHDPDKVDSGFPAGITQCGYGFAGSIHFPHCWNGQEFDINNPYDHMSYPMGDHPDSGYCPPSHPKPMPHIFIEFWFDPKAVQGLYTANDKPWVLSNGDPTGYGFHADFINGWDEGALLKAMTSCNIGESGRPLSDCFDVYTPDERKACTIAPTVTDVLDGWVDKLPGCNPVQSGPAAATNTPNCDAAGNAKVVATPTGSVTKVSATFPASSVAEKTASPVAPVASKASSGVVEPLVQMEKPSSSKDAATATSTSKANAAIPASNDTDSNSSSSTSSSEQTNEPQSTLPANWISAGCYTDAIRPARSLNGITLANLGPNTPMSVAGCINYCKTQNYKIAGLEYGTQCFCDNELENSQKTTDDVCSMACQGSGDEMCGGVAALSIYTEKGVQLGKVKRRGGVWGEGVGRVRRL